jgi:hypothetical protein
MPKPIELQIARDQLVRINDKLDTPHLLIGGLAVQRYVPMRDSKDIDLVCDSETSRMLARELFPTADWDIVTNDDEYRPTLTVRHRSLDMGEIIFGPKITERDAYTFINWDQLLASGVPFELALPGDTKRVLERIVIPCCASLAFTKLISFLSRNKSHTKKRNQDLQDFADLTNNESFRLIRLISVIQRAGAGDYIRSNFLLTPEELAVLGGSSILRVSDIFSGCLRPPVCPVGEQVETHHNLQQVSELSRPSPGDMRMDLTIGYQHDKYTDEQLLKLGKAIVGLLELGEEVRVVRKRPGSVIITIDLPAGKAEQLVEFVSDEKLLQFGVLRAEKLALGREEPVSCHIVWDWLVSQIAKKLRVHPAAITSRATFGELNASDYQVEELLSMVGESYRIDSITTDFASFLRGKYSLREIDAWNYVPVGDLSDFVHKNHGLDKQKGDPECE